MEVRREGSTIPVGAEPGQFVGRGLNRKQVDAKPEAPKKKTKKKK